ncbi:unnamed protein product [Urochloa humidicola]
MRSPGPVRRTAMAATGGDAAHPVAARGARAACCAACGEPRTEATAIAGSEDLRGDGRRSCGDGSELQGGSELLFLSLVTGGELLSLPHGRRREIPHGRRHEVFFPMDGGEVFFLSSCPAARHERLRATLLLTMAGGAIHGAAVESFQ